MQVLCGTDIIEINRIKESIERSGEHFLKTIYTEEEIKYCKRKKNAKYTHYAGRFAAKEAIFKAVSSLLKNKYEIAWTDVQVINDENGRPNIEFLNKQFNNIKSIDISISHCKNYAVATVTILV